MTLDEFKEANPNMVEGFTDNELKIAWEDVVIEVGEDASDAEITRAMLMWLEDEREAREFDDENDDDDE